MPSPFDKMKSRIARGFRGKLHTGTIRQIPILSLDEYGDQVLDTTPVDATFTGVRESFDASWARTAGIPETDVSILVLLGSVRPSTVVPKQDNLVFIESTWHKIRRVMEIDPAGATMRVQAYEVTLS